MAVGAWHGWQLRGSGCTWSEVAAFGLEGETGTERTCPPAHVMGIAFGLEGETGTERTCPPAHVMGMVGALRPTAAESGRASSAEQIVDTAVDWNPDGCAGGCADGCAGGCGGRCGESFLERCLEGLPPRVPLRTAGETVICPLARVPCAAAGKAPLRATRGEAAWRAAEGAWALTVFRSAVPSAGVEFPEAARHPGPVGKTCWSPPAAWP